MPLPFTASCFSEIQMVLPFWYRLTRVVSDKGPLSGCMYARNQIHEIVADSSTFLRPNVCEKKFTSFCQVLKQMNAKANWFRFFLPHGVEHKSTPSYYLPACTPSSRGSGPPYTYTHPFNGPLSGTTQVSRYQKGKTKLPTTSQAARSDISTGSSVFAGLATVSRQTTSVATGRFLTLCMRRGITSGQRNLTTRPHRTHLATVFDRWRHRSLDPANPHPQTAPRSVHPVAQGSVTRPTHRQRDRQASSVTIQAASAGMTLQKELSALVVPCWTQAQKGPGSNRSRDAVG